MIDNAFECDDRLTKPSERRVYSVSQITREVKWAIEEAFPPVWVEGEVSNLKRHTSGHLYFTLKDAEAQIACVMWRGRNQSLLFRPDDGMKVRVLGSLSVYERQGKYQLDLERIVPAGIGEMQMAFEALKQRLADEGLFDSDCKKSLPLFPRCIGIITSPTGAVIRDIRSVIARRFPSVRLVLAPVRVQGDGAAEEIAEAIDAMNIFSEPDVIILGRGGGSLEDLWPFNEERVARAIHNSAIPIISAVGHAIDYSIADFVADVRAPTPSAAAELVVRDRLELLQMLEGWRSQSIQTLRERMHQSRERIESITVSYGFRRPLDRVREQHLRLDDLSKRCERILSRNLERWQARVQKSENRLQALNPHAVLKRGYSITTRLSDGAVVTSASALTRRDAIRVRFYEGAIRGVVNDLEGPLHEPEETE